MTNPASWYMKDMFRSASKFNQPLCWTQRSSDTSYFFDTGCPLVDSSNPAGQRNCWGEGTPTKGTPILATLRPTAAPTPAPTAPTPAPTCKGRGGK